MKKIAALILILAICLCICACKSDEVRAAERTIDAIGPVTTGSEVAILKTEMYYDCLSPEEKRSVKNREILFAARKEFDALWETVEITMDNWTDYFDLTETVEWYEEASEESKGFLLTTSFRLKEQYANASIDRDYFSIKLLKSPSLQHCDYDLQNKTYHFTHANPDNLLTSDYGDPPEIIELRYVEPYFQFGSSRVSQQDQIVCRDGSFVYKFYEITLAEIHVLLTYAK